MWSACKLLKFKGDSIRKVGSLILRWSFRYHSGSSCSGRIETYLSVTGKLVSGLSAGFVIRAQHSLQLLQSVARRGLSLKCTLNVLRNYY